MPLTFSTLHEQARFQDLDERACLVDALAEKAAGQSAGVEAAAEVSAKRRFLLLDLEAAGCFDDVPGEDVRAAAAAFPAVGSFVQAAQRLRSYYRSPVRKEYLENAQEPRSLVSAPVALDWFRFPAPGPEGFSEDEWLAYCEYWLATSMLAPGGSELYFRVRGRACVLLRRYDDGIHPAIYHARLI